MSTSIPVSLLVFDLVNKHEDVLFINASGDQFYERDNKTRKNVLQNIDQIITLYKERLVKPEISALADRQTLQKNKFNLLAERYVLTKEEIQITQLLQSKETQQLFKLANMIRPQVLKDEDVEDAVIFKEVITSDLPSHGFIRQPEREIRVKSELDRAEKFRLLPYDILVSIKGSTGKVGIVSDELDEKWIAGQVFQIIRLPQTQTLREDAVSLFMYLKSTIGQMLLHKMNAGASIPMIPSSSLKSLDVPLLTQQEKTFSVKNFESEIELFQKIDGIKKQIAEIHSNYF